jgi:hypothetical protein
MSRIERADVLVELQLLMSARRVVSISGTDFDSDVVIVSEFKTLGKAALVYLRKLPDIPAYYTVELEPYPSFPELCMSSGTTGPHGRDRIAWGCSKVGFLLQRGHYQGVALYGDFCRSDQTIAVLMRT